MSILRRPSRCGLGAIVWTIAVVLGAQDARGEERRYSLVDHHRTTIYHSPETPGYTCWVGAWLMPNNDMMVAFTQATGPVEGRAQAPPEILRRLSWNSEYDMTGLEMRNVHLRSADHGKTWRQVSADPFQTTMNGVSGECETALPDGTVIRGVYGFYLPYDKELPQTGFLQRSRDETQTWGLPQVPFPADKCLAWPRRLRLLRDGRLLSLWGVAWKPADSLTRNEFNQLVEPMLIVSADQGETWSEPIAVVPSDQQGGWTEEFDVAELPGGDLVCVLRRANDAQRWQSVLEKSENTWRAGKVGPSTLPHSGQPELLATREGPILHLATNGLHWTDDAGKTWNRFEAAGTAYYPRAVQAADGRIFVFGHIGGDDAYGKVDQAIVMDEFHIKPE